MGLRQPGWPIFGRPLIDACLDNSFEHPYYLDLQSGQVSLDMAKAYTGTSGIGWDDEENEKQEAILSICSEARGLAATNDLYERSGTSS